ncbi:glucoamylase-like protein [Leptomonas seymouri]|uniref:Glucoamylase-like protein n=1 Tax=Leptomonas seymouri TaxID=5684 RepID=A0A0N1PDM9_LEPSE|nr:glucoamylase-like protein [Leptomonas seymouri]|eukprot:KPI85812.1 glucoamylase-like protein [Leptomonas seymouri]
MDSSVAGHGSRAVASASTSCVAGRWAEAFQRNVLARHNAAFSEPNPSRRPTPHGSTTTTTTTSTTTTTAAVHRSSSDSHNASRSQSQSAQASPTPHSSHTASSAEGGSDAAGATPPYRSITASRSVSAVAVHPPLSRGSKRAAMAPASAGRFASVPSTSCDGSHPAATTMTAGATGAAFHSAQMGTHSSEPKVHATRSLPPPPPPTALRQASNNGTSYFTTSITTTPNRSAPPPQSAAAAFAASQPSHIYTTPQARLNPNSNKVKTKPLSQLHQQNQRSGNVSGGPGSAVGTPHIPCVYASSPFFQRVNDTAAANSPIVRTACDNAAHPPSQSIENTPQVKTEEEAEDSALLQVTPITNGGGSWRHDSQLLSQPREVTGPSAAPAAASEYFNAFNSKLGGGGTYRDPSIGLMSFGVSQFHPPPSMPVPLESVASASQTMHAFSRSNSSDVADSGAVACSWDADASSAFAQKTSPFRQAMYNPPGRAVESSSARCKPPYIEFTSPYPSAGEMTLLSASPGGLSGSHNATMSTITLQQSAMTSGMMMPADSVTVDGAAAARYLQRSSHLYNGAGGVSPYFRNGLHAEETYPPGLHSHAQQQWQPHSSLQSHSPSPSQTYSAVAQRGGNDKSVNLGSVPTVSGVTTATTTAAIASGLSGVALERQLLHASKEELVQILLELGSCNPEASRFIDAKAFFFAFRHEHSRVSTASATEAVADTPMSQLPANTDGCSSSSSTVGKGQESRQEQRKVMAERTVNAPSRAKPDETSTSGNRGIARCIFPAETAGDDEADGEGNDSTSKENDTIRQSHENLKAPALAVGGNDGSPPERRVRPEERAFSTEAHPCLRWYGACRNATSCVYASLPCNLCLNWVRGACMAHTECSGVHRLPDPCPLELHRIYLLNHGLPRGGVGHRLHALPLSLTTPAVPQEMQKSQQHLHESVGTGIAAQASVRNCIEGAVGRKDGGVLHTPLGQAIDKDAFMGGGSTPHRHQPHGLLEGADAKIGARRSPWSAMDVITDKEENLPAANSYRQDSRISGAISPTGSSCSTVEDKAMSDPVSRCLGQDFDCAVSVTCQSGINTMPGGLAAESSFPVVSYPSGVVERECGGRRSPVMLPVCEVNAPLSVVPLHWMVSETGEQEEEDYTDVSAPAAGTRTRMQSPSFV